MSHNVKKGMREKGELRVNEGGMKTTGKWGSLCGVRVEREVGAKSGGRIESKNRGGKGERGRMERVGACEAAKQCIKRLIPDSLCVCLSLRFLVLFGARAVFNYLSSIY